VDSSALQKDPAAEWADVASLVPNPLNAELRDNEASIPLVMASISELGFGAPLVARKANRMLIAGHTRLEAAKRLGWDAVPCRFMDIEQDAADKLMLADNRLGEKASWRDAGLKMAAERFGLDAMALAGWKASEIPGWKPPGAEEQARKTLAERFIVPPFSVLDARQGYWQERKRAWIALGIESDLGRGPNLLKMSASANQVMQPGGAKAYKQRHGGSIQGLTDHISTQAYRKAGEELASAEGTSIFDPVLCELLVRWFSPPGGRILDPFAGGSVRGIISALLGREYIGIDLRPEQCAANEEQAARIVKAPEALPGGRSSWPAWICGDSLEVLEAQSDPEGPSDFILSCPPYGDLEQYSDDPRDLSRMSEIAFISAMGGIVSRCARRLADDRFAAFVVGDYRRKDGSLTDFPSRTISIFRDAGMSLYNEAVLITAAGSLPIRAGRIFEGGRKLGKAHQNVLIFCKGDPKKAAAACGTIGRSRLFEPAPRSCRCRTATSPTCRRRLARTPSRSARGSFPSGSIRPSSAKP